MVLCSQLTAGMIIRLENKIYRVDSVSKVAIGKAKAFMQLGLCDLQSYKEAEKKLKVDQEVQEVQLLSSCIEFLYPEDRGFTFLDIDELEQVYVDQAVVGPKINYLKEGVQVVASRYGGEVYAIELPQFLELMVAKVDAKAKTVQGEHMVVLETGAKISAPLFVEEGDVVKVDTRSEEFVQRV